MNFDHIRVMAATGPEGERFAAVWTMPAVSMLSADLTIAPGLDPHRNALLERIGACAMQPECELHRRLSALGLSEADIADKFVAARQWMTTITVSSREYECGLNAPGKSV